MNTTTVWKLVPAAPNQDWTNAFASRGPRIGTFDTTIRDVLATAPAPAFDLQDALQGVRDGLAFLPPGDAAIAGLDRIIAIFGAAPGGAADDTPARTGNTAKEQDMFAAGLEVGEANAKNNAAIRAAASASPVAPGDAQEYGSPADVASRIEQFIAANGRQDSTTLLLYEAMTALRRPAPAACDAPGTVSPVTRQGPCQQLFTYASQPCDNVIPWRIGEACSKASQAPAGDYIDRGLSLLKELQAKGYGIADISAQLRGQGAE